MKKRKRGFKVECSLGASAPTPFTLIEIDQKSDDDNTRWQSHTSIQ